MEIKGAYSSFLAGPFASRPDILIHEGTISSKEEMRKGFDYDKRENADGSLTIHVESKPAMATVYEYEGDSPSLLKLNVLSWIPFLSSGIGLTRACIGLIHTVRQVANLFFDWQNRSKHAEEILIGLYSVARGCIEIVPVIGNLSLIIYDLVRLKRVQTQFRQTIIERLQNHLPS